VSGERPESVLPVAGWYPHPGSGTQLRWWVGDRWTDQYSPAAEVAAPVQQTDEPGPIGPPPAQPHVPTTATASAAEERRWDTVWVWFLALSPLLSFATGFGALSRFVTTDAPAWQWVALVLLPYAAIVASAVFDEHKLHTWHRDTAPWAWACLGALPYLIARTVVLRRGGTFGSAPLWVALGSVLAVVLAVVAMVAVFLLAINQLSNATY
jgi:hypothetical protein